VWVDAELLGLELDPRFVCLERAASAKCSASSFLCLACCKAASMFLSARGILPNA
jgi:hypothetical protein